MDSNLINQFLITQFILFKYEYQQQEATVEQKLRGLSILWLIYYFADDINEDIIFDIATLVNTKCTLKLDHDCFKLAPLTAACFALSKDQTYSDYLMEILLLTPQAEVAFVIDCFTIISPLLSFYNEQLKQLVEKFNAENNTYYKEMTYLYLSTKGDGTDKKVWIKAQKKITNSGQLEFFEKLQHRLYKQNTSFFAEMFNQVKTFILLNILNNAKQIPDIVFTKHSIDHLRENENSHPLNHYKIKMDYFYSDK
jgi:hypothetical protein